MPLKLASLNIEGNKHFAKFVPFLKEYGADAICLQEVYERDIPMLERELGMKAEFAPMTLKRYSADDPTPDAAFGVAIFSRLPFPNTEQTYYYGDRNQIPVYEYRIETTVNRVLLAAEFEKDGRAYRVATTHFIVTEKGEANDFQRRDLAKLMKVLDRYSSIIMCGDFNAPRGGEIFSKIAERFTDNIPARYTTSIDGNIHRAGPIPFMVDGLFTSPHYSASNVELVSGLSDHCGITATIEQSA